MIIIDIIKSIFLYIIKCYTVYTKINAATFVYNPANIERDFIVINQETLKTMMKYNNICGTPVNNIIRYTPFIYRHYSEDGQPMIHTLAYQEYDYNPRAFRHFTINITHDGVIIDGNIFNKKYSIRTDLLGKNKFYLCALPDCLTKIQLNDYTAKSDNYVINYMNNDCLINIQYHVEIHNGDIYIITQTIAEVGGEKINVYNSYDYLFGGIAADSYTLHPINLNKITNKGIQKNYSANNFLHIDLDNVYINMPIYPAWASRDVSKTNILE